MIIAIVADVDVDVVVVVGGIMKVLNNNMSKRRRKKSQAKYSYFIMINARQTDRQTDREKKKGEKPGRKRLQTVSEANQIIIMYDCVSVYLCTCA